MVFIKYNNFEINHYLKFLIFCSTIIIAYLSWKFIELPFRNEKKIDNKLFFYILSPILLILIIYGFQLHTTNGFEKNYFNKLSDSQKIEYRSIKSLFEDKKNNIYNDINFPCKKWNNKINLKSEKQYESCEKKFKKSLIILGDSHGLDVFNSISKVIEYDFVYGIGTPGCRVFNQTKCNYEDYFNFIKKIKIQFS